MQTDRLLIRRVRSEDWPAVQAIWRNQAEAWYGQYDKPHDLSDASVQAKVARWDSFKESTDHMFFAVCLADTFIGYIAFNKRDTGYEVGYNFHADYHRHGYAKESLTALFAELRRHCLTEKIFAGTALKNAPSVALLTSLGFRLTGTEQVSFYQDENGNSIWFDGGIFEKKIK